VKIAVFGMGYVGVVTACGMAREHQVWGVDFEERLNDLKTGKFAVPGTQELIKKVNFITNPRIAMDLADISFVCVGTPSLKNGNIDLAQVMAVSREIGKTLEVAREGHLVVLRSTVLPSTTRSIVVRIIEERSGVFVGDGWEICYNPEFLREKTAMTDFDSPIRILIGERIKDSGKPLIDCYKEINTQRFIVSLEVAEAVKYTDNAFHALKATFANEMGRLWEDDAERVMSVVAADERLNASSAYLKSGWAFGGSCLPKDVQALVKYAEKLNLPVLKAILPSNEEQKANDFRTDDGV